MNHHTPCPTCGKPLPTDAPMGVCPDCLLGAGFGTVTEDGRAEKLRAFEPPRPEELAAHFPQLEITELLGRGGMGAVYKARQTELDRAVALKILPPSIGDEPGFAERFAREAKALAKLNHPGIVTIHDFGRADGLYYFLMEYVDGVNLRQLLQGERIAPREALAIVPQICDALQFAHDHGIVHRDIKPENILLDRRGRVKVADFGIAKLTGTDEQTGPESGVASSAFTEAGKVMGTPIYMAPEQASHPGEVDHRADIYALGVVFYQMLTGELPGKDVQAPSSKVQVDVRLDEIVLRALARKPELRYQHASVLKTQVEELARAEPQPIAQPARSKGSPSVAGSWSERHRSMPKILWLTLSLLAAGILSKSLLLLKSRGGPLDLADLLLQVLLVLGLWFRVRLAYLATILAGLFGLPAVAQQDWPRALLGIAVLAAVVVPVLWSTSWFLPAEMPAGRRRAWIASTAALTALAVALGFAFPPPAMRSPSSSRFSASDADSKFPSESTRRLAAPPFIAHYQQGTIELLALAPHPSANAQPWLPNGAPAETPFPSESGTSEAEGKVVKELAFRIRSPKGRPGSPVFRFPAKSGISEMGQSQNGNPSTEAGRISVKHAACPPDATETNVKVGVADGVWEVVIAMPAGGDKLYGSRQQTGDDGKWDAGFQGLVAADGTVALSFHFNRREDWETSLVAVMEDATVKPIQSARLTGSEGVWRGLTSFSKEEFARVAEISLRRRRYQWVEFRHVSLVPGHTTTVEVSDAAEVAPLAASASRPPAAPWPGAFSISAQAQALLKRTFDPSVPLIDERHLWGMQMAGDSPIEFTGKVERVMDFASRRAEDPRNTPHEVSLKLIKGQIPQFPDARRFIFVPRYEAGIPSLERFQPSQEVVFICSKDGAIRAMKNVPSFAALKKATRSDLVADGTEE